MFIGSTAEWAAPGRIGRSHAGVAPWLDLAPILILALAIRLALVSLPIAHHPDEIWQYLEPAHHLIAGDWVMSWEQRAGARGWLLPLLVAGPMTIGNAIDSTSMLAVEFARAAFAVASLSVVVSAFVIGARLSRVHGLIAGFVAAVWFELAYFGPRVLSETASVALVLPAVALMTHIPAERVRQRLMIAGLLLGLAFAIRFHLAPALAVLVIAACRADWRGRWRPLVTGGATALAIAGFADAVAGHVPLLWIWENFAQNIIADRSSSFGVEEAFWYIDNQAGMWWWAALAVWPLALVGARRHPHLLIAAAVNVAVHSVIPHKEYRFILLSVTLVMLLAAIGSVDAMRHIARGRSARFEGAMLGAVLAGWIGASALGAMSPQSGQRAGGYSEMIENIAAAGRVPGVCATALFDAPNSLIFARVFYRQPTPVYSFNGAAGRAAALAHRDAYNVVISPWRAAEALGPGYRARGCTQPYVPGERPPEHCLFVREGGCAGAAPPRYDINAVLARERR